MRRVTGRSVLATRSEEPRSLPGKPTSTSTMFWTCNASVAACGNTDNLEPKTRTFMTCGSSGVAAITRHLICVRATARTVSVGAGKRRRSWSVRAVSSFEHVCLLRHLRSSGRWRPPTCGISAATYEAGCDFRKYGVANARASGLGGGGVVAVVSVSERDSKKNVF